MRRAATNGAANPTLRRGDLVALRPPAEILATLDASGALDGLPFMPEMLGYYGRVHRVSARAERACDAVSRARRLPHTVLLEDVRCDGQGHDGCDASCLIFWKEAWLRRVENAEAATVPADDDALRTLQELTSRQARSTPDQGTRVRYRCQMTELLSASELVPYWSARSFLREVTSGNVSVRTFLRVLGGIIANEPRRRSRGQKPFPAAGTHRPPPGTADLQPGTTVHVRTADEIADTLDDHSKLRGLWFDREMVPYCDTTTTVKKRVRRFIDENTREMVVLKSDCYILDGVACNGHLSDGRWFCPRQINLWWREAWLRPEEGRPSTSGSNETVGVPSNRP